MQRNKPPPDPSRKAKRSFAGIHDPRRLGGQDSMAGSIIVGRYEIIDRIGKDGMAKEFLAMERKSGDSVAIKLLDGDPQRHAELTERLFIEARAAARINHPNVINIHDIGLHEGCVFCVMEYVDGPALSEIMVKGKPLGWQRTENILAQICDALDAAHEQGILHRDLKPENIMLIKRGGAELVKVLDFGLAKLTDNSDRLTREDIILGTPSYMAPEQAWSREYDHRVDIYSLGIMAYELACGSLPFRSDSADDKARTIQILLMHKEAIPEAPNERNPEAGIPPNAEAAIMRAIAKNPDDRFTSAGEFKAALLPHDYPKRRSIAPAPEGPDDVSGRSLRPAPASKKPSGAAPPTEPAQMPRQGDGLVMEMDETWGRWLASRLKRTILAGAIAAAIITPIYHFRSDIAGFGSVALEGEEAQAPVAPPQADQAPSPGASLTTQSTYQARIESNPEGASVFQETGTPGKLRRLGSTPLDVTFQNWENPVIVTKRGYRPARVVITKSAPSASVSLRRLTVPAAAPMNERADQEDGGAAPDEDNNGAGGPGY